MSEVPQQARRIWENMSPELKETLSHLAFSDQNETISPELKDRIQSNSLQDVVESAEGDGND